MTANIFLSNNAWKKFKPVIAIESQVLIMIVYNVTIKVDPEIQEAWLTWLKEEHIPDMINTGCFTHAVILHLLEEDDEEGITYAVQYHSENRSNYDRYIENFAEALRKKGTDRWGNRFISFRTVMQVVN